MTNESDSYTYCSMIYVVCRKFRHTTMNGDKNKFYK